MKKVGICNNRIRQVAVDYKKKEEDIIVMLLGVRVLTMNFIYIKFYIKSIHLIYIYNLSKNHY